jgi:hypothetical protein
VEAIEIVLADDRTKPAARPRTAGEPAREAGTAVGG